MEIVLSYSPSLNRFVDEDSIVIHDISRLFDNWQIQDWLASEKCQYGQDSLVTAKTGDDVRLVYLNAEEEDDLFDFLGIQDSYGVKTDRTYY